MNFTRWLDDLDRNLNTMKMSGFMSSISLGNLTGFPLKDPRYTAEWFPVNFGVSSTADTRPVRFSGSGIFVDISIAQLPQPRCGKWEGEL
jgi:hypothetical protein